MPKAAAIAATLTRDPEVLAAAVLHDTVEDAGISLEQLRRQFGDRVAELVALETEDKGRGGAPELSWVASKSGSMNACRNDGGIIHTPYGEYVIVLMNKEFHDIIEYNDHPAMVYGARVSRMILDQILACEGKLYLK